MPETAIQPRFVVPDKFKRSLKKGEFAVYRKLGCYMEDGRFTGADLLLPTQDVIQDPESGDLIPIAYVRSYSAMGVPDFGEINFLTTGMCQLMLKHGAQDAGAYQFMEITNFNASNPNRDPAAPASFERVDTMDGSKMSRNARATKIKALQLATSFSDDELLAFVTANQHKERSFHVAYLPDGTPDMEQLRDIVERIAESSPIRFMGYNSTLPVAVSSTRELIDYAISVGLIDFDKEAKGWYNAASGKTFLIAKSIKNGVPKIELEAWLQTKEGKNVLKLITEAKVEFDEQEKQAA